MNPFGYAQAPFREGGALSFHLSKERVLSLRNSSDRLILYKDSHVGREDEIDGNVDVDNIW